MPMKIRFDKTHNPEKPTFVLATVSGSKIGMIQAERIICKGSMLNADEFSFSVYKYLNGVKNPIWDDIKDFRLIWIKEYDLWFQIRVETDESTKTVKSVYGTQLGQAELSQINLYDVQINTEDDIARDDYEPSVLYNPDNPNASILNRIFEKAPHYSITYVDPSIANIQRTFSFDGKSIYDSCKEIAEEIGCLFVFPSNSDTDGSILRTVRVYDLESVCNDCGYRGDFTGSCPKCGGTDVINGFGNDTGIFVSVDDLGKSIRFSTDNDAVKNCFKLQGGDDLMTATIRNVNPNGTDYIWYFTDEMRQDMSAALRSGLNSYDTLYRYMVDEYSNQYDADTVTAYNYLVTKYAIKYAALYDGKTLQSLPSNAFVGYDNLVRYYYDIIDFLLFLQSDMMPSPTLSDTSASEQAALLTVSSLSPVAVPNISSLSLATANNVVLNMAKVIVDSRYQVKIQNSSIADSTDGNNNPIKLWSGIFVVTNYSDENDTATTSTISNIVINDDEETYIKRKIEQALKKYESESYGIIDLFEFTTAKFTLYLQSYCLNSLKIFYDACQACLEIMIEQGISDNGGETWNYQALYHDLYLDYYNKLGIIETEIARREHEIAIISSNDPVVISSNDPFYSSLSAAAQSRGTITSAGESTKVYINVYQTTLDFQKYITNLQDGNDLWLELFAYRREDLYSNENYISDGLGNDELIERAMEFLTTAQNEIFKSSELQHSISAKLRNLLADKRFASLADQFEEGCWLRVQSDDTVYKLRLLEYEIDFDNIADLSVEFSDVLKTASGESDQQSLIQKTFSMATSYDSVKRQASKGNQSDKTIKSWVQNGLSLTTTKIVNEADEQTVVYDSHGILLRQWDDIAKTYLPQQTKIINKGLYITTDNWETSRAGIGEFQYYDPRTNQLTTGYGVIADTVVTSLLLSEDVGIYTATGNITLNENGIEIKKAIADSDPATVFKVDADTGDVILSGRMAVYRGTDNVIGGYLGYDNGLWTDGHGTAQSYTDGMSVRSILKTTPFSDYGQSYLIVTQTGVRMTNLIYYTADIVDSGTPTANGYDPASSDNQGKYYIDTSVSAGSGNVMVYHSEIVSGTYIWVALSDYDSEIIDNHYYAVKEYDAYLSEGNFHADNIIFSHLRRIRGIGGTNYAMLDLYADDASNDYKGKAVFRKYTGSGTISKTIDYDWINAVNTALGIT